MQPRRPYQRRGMEALPKDLQFDFRNVDLMGRFVDDDGRIRSRRRTRASAKQQRMITQAVKLARYMALLPYTSTHVRLYGGD